MHVSVCVATLSLAACGGGSSDDSSASSVPLSANQQAYESFALAQNGGQHGLQGQLAFTSNTSDTSGTLTLNAAQSTFYTQDASVASSPGLTQMLPLTTGTTTLTPSLAILQGTSQRVLVNGVVMQGARPASVSVNYTAAGNVQKTYYAADGKTVMITLLDTNYTSVPLSGAIAQSPSELFTDSALGLLTNTLNGAALYNKSATWQSGAAYMKVTQQYVNDTVLVNDCAAPATTGTTLTPCASSATQLEAFFPFTSAADAKTYALADGQIVTLGGVRAWVANTAIADPTPRYRVYFENGGHIDTGVLVRAGTTLDVKSTGGTPTDFSIVMNRAAIQSIQASLVAPL